MKQQQTKPTKIKQTKCFFAICAGGRTQHCTNFIPRRLYFIHVDNNVPIFRVYLCPPSVAVCAGCPTQQCTDPSSMCTCFPLHSVAGCAGGPVQQCTDPSSMFICVPSSLLLVVQEVQRSSVKKLFPAVCISVMWIVIFPPSKCMFPTALCCWLCRRSNAAVYLIVVAVTDLAALYTGLLRQVIFRTTGRDIREERYVFTGFLAHGNG